MRNLLFLFLAIILISCKSDEKIVDNSDNSFKLLISMDNEPPSLQVISYPSKTIVFNDAYFENNQEYLPSPVERIASYRGLIYLIMPEAQQVFVIDETTFKRVGVIDFSVLSLGPLKPISICFGNMTDAYISHKNSPYVSLIDLTNFEIAKNINCKKNVYDMACSGNQVLLSNWKDKCVSVLDTRTDSVAAVIPVGDVPTSIDFTKDGSKAMVVCCGTGKIDSLSTKTSAYAYLIDINTRKVTKTIEIGAGVINSVNQIPKGIAITNQSWAFVPTQECFMRLDARGTDNKILVERKEYYSVLYNYKKDKLLVVRKNNNIYEGLISNTVSGKPESTFEIPQNFKLIYPL